MTYSSETLHNDREIFIFVSPEKCVNQRYKILTPNRQYVLTLGMLGNFFNAFVVVCLLFSKSAFPKKSFRNTIRVSNGSDTDHNQLSVGPDLETNCLHFRLSADNKSRC